VIRPSALPHYVTPTRVTDTGTKDARGNPVTVRTTGTPLKARVDPMTADEVLGLEQREEVNFIVFLLPSADGQVDANDELLWLERDLVLKVDGPPLALYDLPGRLHHLEVNAHRITGA
jgi:hypothetical protein